MEHNKNRSNSSSSILHVLVSNHDHDKNRQASSQSYNIFLFSLADLSFIPLVTIPSRILLLVFLSACDTGVLLGFLEVSLVFLEEVFQDHGCCIFVGVVWGFKSKRTKL